MKKKKINKVFRIIILLVFFILLILLCIFGIKKIIKNKYKKILLDNDSINYELTKIIDGIEEQTAKLRNNVLVVEDTESLMWINKNEKKSIVINKESKTAIVTSENDLKIASLNETYIKEYFENSDCKFKYLGKENNYALLQFTNKKTGLVNILYLNLDTKLIEKQVIKNDIAENIIEYKIKLNSVSKDEVKEPELIEYYVVTQ